MATNNQHKTTKEVNNQTHKQHNNEANTHLKNKYHVQNKHSTLSKQPPANHLSNKPQ